MKTVLNAFSSSFQTSSFHVISLGSVFVGALWLIGWVFHLEQLRGLFAVWPAMQTPTTLTIVLAGLALWIPGMGSSNRRRPALPAMEESQPSRSLSLRTLSQNLRGLALGLDVSLGHSPHTGQHEHMLRSDDLNLHFQFSVTGNSPSAP